MEVIVQDANNIVIEVDQGRQGRGVADVSLITVGADYYLLFTFTDGTTEQVGPVATTVTEVISAEVRNAEAVTILKGQPVYLYQAQGNLATVKLAFNTSDATSAKTLGLAAENIAPNAQGLVTCQGTLPGLNTGAYNEGDTLYLGATAGTLTNVKPQAPNHLVYIGVVERANAGAGQIYVRVQNGFELDEIHDVQINSPVNGNTLIYDASTSLWKNAGITAGTGVSVTNGASSITVGNTGVLSLSGGTTGLTPATATSGAVTLAGTLGIANGGTGQTTANAALNALLPAQTSQPGKYLKTDGTNASWDQLDISTADITGVLPTANGGTGLSSFTANRVFYSSSTSAIGQSANLTFDGTTLTANALTLTNNPTFNGGTANGVLYLNGSKVATSGGALTFDGSNMGVGSAAGSNARLFAYANDATLPTLMARQDGAGPIQVWQSPGGAEAMRFNSAGILLLGQTVTGLQNSNSAALAPTAGNQFTLNKLSGSGSGNAYINFGLAGSAIGSIKQNGTTGIALNSASQLVFESGGATEAARFDATQNLLVGTTTNTNSSRLTVNGTISETVSSVQYLVASQFDVGTAPNKIPLNQYLGNLAYQNASAIAGQAGFSAGTAALPSISSATDLTTGRWFPAAGVMAWSTGGTERMRLSANGNLLVGLTSDTNSARGVFGGSVISSTNTISTFSGDYAGFDRTSAKVMRIFSGTGDATGSVIDFYTGVSGSVNSRMLLDASGNLGIGTSSPSERLHLVAAAPTAYVQGTGASDAAVRTKTTLADFKFGAGVGSATNCWNVYDLAVGAERMRIDASGNLGLGVTPSAWISVYRAIELGATGSVYGRTDNTIESAIVANAYRNSSGNWVYRQTNIAGRFGYDSIGNWSWFTAPSGTAGNTISFTQAMTLDASGNLLVNTTTSSGRLTVQQASSTIPAAYFRNANSFTGGANSTIPHLHVNSGSDTAGDTTRIAMTVGTGSNVYLDAINVGGVGAGSDLAIYTRPSGGGVTERMRIDSSGNLIQTAPTTPPTLSTNGTMVFNLTSNTNLRVSVRGSDGVTRVANITLA